METKRQRPTLAIGAQAHIHPEHKAVGGNLVQRLNQPLAKPDKELLVIQGTIISAERVAQDAEPLNLKTFISGLDVPVVAGGVLDHRTALHLMRTGAAGVIVGYGSTDGVTTSDEVLGISVPMATAIAGRIQQNSRYRSCACSRVRPVAA